MSVKNDRVHKITTVATTDQTDESLTIIVTMATALETHGQNS